MAKFLNIKKKTWQSITPKPRLKSTVHGIYLRKAQCVVPTQGEQGIGAQGPPVYAITFFGPINYFLIHAAKTQVAVYRRLTSQLKYMYMYIPDNAAILSG